MSSTTTAAGAATDAANALLTIDNLGKRFGGFVALENIRLSVPAGERLGLIGPNGSGKSTLVNCICGTLQNEVGSVTFNGHRLNGMTANWCMQVSFSPKLMAVSVEHGALTHALIHEGKVFAVSLIDREDRAIVRKFTKPVEVDLDRQTLNEVAYVTRTTGAPVLAGAVAWLDCELREEIDAGGHTVFVGEVVDAGFDKDEATPVLRMEDTRMNYGG